MRTFIIIISLLITHCVNSHIIESDNILEVLNYISQDKKENTLIVWDLDNTTFHPASVECNNHLGSDQWFCHILEQKLTVGIHKQEIMNHLVPLYLYIQLKTPLALLDNRFPGFIEKLQQYDHVHMIGLTKRGFLLAVHTIKELDRLGINFQIKSPFTHNMIVDLNDAAICRKGVVFCGINNKGKTLEAFCIKHDFFPPVIIVIDDKYHYLEEIKQFCEKYGIRFIGILYTAADHYVKQFDSSRAYEHLKEFLLNNYDYFL